MPDGMDLVGLLLGPSGEAPPPTLALADLPARSVSFVAVVVATGGDTVRIAFPRANALAFGVDGTGSLGPSYDAVEKFAARIVLTPVAVESYLAGEIDVGAGGGLGVHAQP